MIRLNQTNRPMSVSAEPPSYSHMIDLETMGSKLTKKGQVRSGFLWTLVVAATFGYMTAGLAEVAFNEGEERPGAIPADLGALGTETSTTEMACWQNGEEIFNASEFNTVVLGVLAGENAITLKNNSNGTEALAISLNDSLCFVTIEP